MGEKLEKSGNFVSPEKWEPCCVKSPLHYTITQGRGVVYSIYTTKRGCIPQATGEWDTTPLSGVNAVHHSLPLCYGFIL